MSLFLILAIDHSTKRNQLNWGTTFPFYRGGGTVEIEGASEFHSVFRNDLGYLGYLKDFKITLPFDKIATLHF